MTDELREKVARELNRKAYEIDGMMDVFVPDEIPKRYYWLADAILAIPEIAAAIRLVTIESHPLSR